jgi:hypothetical protein
MRAVHSETLRNVRFEFQKQIAHGPEENGDYLKNGHNGRFLICFNFYTSEFNYYGNVSFKK